MAGTALKWPLILVGLRIPMGSAAHFCCIRPAAAPSQSQVLFWMLHPYASSAMAGHLESGTYSDRVLPPRPEQPLLLREETSSKLVARHHPEIEDDIVWIWTRHGSCRRVFRHCSKQHHVSTVSVLLRLVFKIEILSLPG